MTMQTFMRNHSSCSSSLCDWTKETSRSGYAWRRRRQKQRSTQHAAFLRCVGKWTEDFKKCTKMQNRILLLEQTSREHSQALDVISDLGYALFDNAANTEKDEIPGCSHVGDTARESFVQRSAEDSKCSNLDVPKLPMEISDQIESLAGRSLPLSAYPAALADYAQATCSGVIYDWTQNVQQREDATTLDYIPPRPDNIEILASCPDDDSLVASGAITPRGVNAVSTTTTIQYSDFVVPPSEMEPMKVSLVQTCPKEEWEEEDDRIQFAIHSQPDPGDSCQVQVSITKAQHTAAMVRASEGSLQLSSDSLFLECRSAHQAAKAYRAEQQKVGYYVLSLIVRASARIRDAQKIQRWWQMVKSKCLVLHNVDTKHTETHIIISDSETSSDDDESCSDALEPGDGCKKSMMSAFAQPFEFDAAVQVCEKCRKFVYKNALTEVALARPTAPALHVCPNCLNILKRWNNRCPGLCPRDVRNWIGRGPAVLRFELGRSRAARLIQRWIRRKLAKKAWEMAHCLSCGSIGRIFSGETLCEYCCRPAR